MSKPGLGIEFPEPIVDCPQGTSPAGYLQCRHMTA